MWRILFTFLFFGFDAKVGGKSVSKDLINDLNAFTELLDEFLEKRSEEETDGKDGDDKDIFQKIEERNEQFNNSLEVEEDGFVTSDGKALELIEGDIVESDDVRRVIEGEKDTDGNVVRDAVTDKSGKKWPNAVVHYQFRSGTPGEIKKAVREAIQEFHTHTCIRWIEGKSKDYVEIYKGLHCCSLIGRRGGRQLLSLGNGCAIKGIAIHEMMHALGFWHEQSRRDRDNYITVVEANIMPGMIYNFQKYSHGEAETFNAAYDIHSIMHYGSHAFSKNGKPTIIAKNGGPVGQTRGLTTIDIYQLNKLYKCDVVKSFTTFPPPEEKTESCKNKDKNCAAWAKAGYCKSKMYKNYMDNNCAKSCDTCLASCEGNDKHHNCAYWASIGECTKNPAWMLPNCCTSCKKG